MRNYFFILLGALLFVSISCSKDAENSEVKPETLYPVNLSDIQGLFVQDFYDPNSTHSYSFKKSTHPELDPTMYGTHFVNISSTTFTFDFTYTFSNSTVYIEFDDNGGTDVLKIQKIIPGDIKLGDVIYINGERFVKSL